jgi:predicted nucleic acid-binding protein
MLVVADASPLTALLHLNKLHLLVVLYHTIYIPGSVANEMQYLIPFGYDISFLNDHSHYIIKSSNDFKLVNELSTVLDHGEAEAIALAKEVNADLLLIDEKLGKEIAAKENIKCKGVIGVLIDAKAKGHIIQLKPLLDDLVNNLKFRISKTIYSLALQKAGEGF